MRKILSYLILFFAIGTLISQSMHDFNNLKLIYYNIYPQKYYEEDKLYVYKKEENNASSSSGFNSWYHGTLDKQKRNKQILYYNTTYLRQNILIDNKGEYLKVWYCQKANKTILRTTTKLKSGIYYRGIISYILILLIIPCAGYLIKNNKYKKSTI